MATLSLPNKQPTLKQSLVRMAVMKRSYCVLPVVELDCWRSLREIEAKLIKQKETGNVRA